MQTITRIAPSPTGKLHIGTARSALFNFLYAKSKKGKFIVRIEDTDKERSKKEYEIDILQNFKTLGINPDEIIYQSKRITEHKKAIEKLLNSNNAYLSKEIKKGETQENTVVRFKNPNIKLTFLDTLRGKITIDTTDLGDFIIARNVNSPLYHLAVVVDDEYSSVTNIIRGDDHISNTPRQILLQQALNFTTPSYTHIPLIHGADGKKLSKRRETTSISEYINTEKILPEALINYLVLLGWHPKDETEIFNLNELINVFSLERIQKGNSMFDLVKLKSINAIYIKNMKKENFENEFKNIKNKYIIQDLKDRIKTFKEGDDLISAGEYNFFLNREKLDIEYLIPKKSNKENTYEYLSEIINLLEKFTSPWEADEIKKYLFPYAKEKGTGAVLWPMRYSLTYKSKSPDVFLVAEALGKKETIDRIIDAKNILL